MGSSLVGHALRKLGGEGQTDHDTVGSPDEILDAVGFGTCAENSHWLRVAIAARANRKRRRIALLPAWYYDQLHEDTDRAIARSTSFQY